MSATREFHEHVEIRRVKNEPNLRHEIRLTATDDASMVIASPLTDFLEAVLFEMGSPALLLTKSALRERMKAAAVRVVDTMKEASVRLPFGQKVAEPPPTTLT